MALRNDLSAQVKADLTSFSSAIDGQGYLLLGENVMGDRTSRIYYYQASSTATPDGDNVIDATAMGSIGRFIKCPIEEFNPTQINADWNSSSGVSSILNKPSIKKQEVASGTTSGSGTFTVTFTNTYSTPPNVQANIINGTNTNLIKIGTPSTTGVTVTVVNRTDVVGLLPSYGAVSGAAVDVLITEK